jgi:hypothetical protein
MKQKPTGRVSSTEQTIRELGVFEYWQARGLPPQCKPVGDDDFECGSP